MSEDFAQKVRACASALATGAALPTATAFRQQLEQARLDGSADSLERLDALLAGLREAGKLNLERLAATAVGDGFLAAVCAAIGLAAQRAHGQPVQWLDRESARAQGIELPADLAHRAIGLHGQTGLLPLNVLTHFQPPGEEGHSCVQYLHSLRELLQGLARADERRTDHRALAAQLLAAAEGGTPPAEGFAYLDEVRALRLDRSLDSLSRLQSMLQRLSPAAQQLGARFINEPANQNFVRWAAFYLGMTAALHARATVKWLNHEELSAMKPDIPFDFVTSQVALVDSDKLYLPLVAIVAALSRDPQGGDLAAWARTLDESVERRLVPLERPRRPALDLNKHWLTALDLAGYQAAFAMGQARDHGQSSPVLVQGQPDGTTLLQDFSMFGDAQAGLQMIDDAIAHNPDKLPFQISVLDSFVNLPTGRVDAVSVNLVVYGGGLMSGRKPLQLVIACPWRPASAGAGFAIQPPVLQHCAGEIALEALAWAFFKGVDRYKFDDFTWRLHEAPARPDLH